MKKSRIGKVIIIVLAFITVFAFASTAFASSKYFPGQNVYGDDPQRYAVHYLRQERNTMDMSIDALNMNGQSNFRFRGYLYNTDTASTILKTIGGTGTYCASYTTDWFVYMDTQYSIASPYGTDWIWFRGSLFV